MRPHTGPHRIVRCKAPRYIRRIIHDISQCNYQREEYRTNEDRNRRWHELRGTVGLVRYSDINSAGLNVFVVSWTRTDDNKNERVGDGVGRAANREATGGPPYLAMPAKFPEIGLGLSSMEQSELPLGNLGKSEIENGLIEH